MANEKLIKKIKLDDTVYTIKDGAARTESEVNAQIDTKIVALGAKLLPVVSTEDSGKILSVVNGAWTAVESTVVYVGTAQPANDLGNDSDLYLQTD